MSKILKQYIRNTAPKLVTTVTGIQYELVGKPNRIGVLVATGPGKIGYSIISPKEPLNETEPVTREIEVQGNKKSVTKRKKKWNSKSIWEFGTNLALERAEGKQPNPEIVPNFIRKQIAQFEDRMKRYYKA